jgi:type IV pilus assembly protein PilX
MTPSLASTCAKRRSAQLSRPLAQQRGVALIMVLMVTLIIVGLSVSIATGVFSEQKFSRNSADHAIARQAAEAALRDAEVAILCQKWNASTKKYEFDASTGAKAASGNQAAVAALSYCSSDPQLASQMGAAGATASCLNGRVLAKKATTAETPTKFNLTDSGCSVAFGAVTGSTLLDGMATPPIYLIEVLLNNDTGNNSATPTFRITARGFGRNPNTAVTLESVFTPLAPS